MELCVGMWKRQKSACIEMRESVRKRLRKAERNYTTQQHFIFSLRSCILLWWTATKIVEPFKQYLFTLVTSCMCLHIYNTQPSVVHAYMLLMSALLRSPVLLSQQRSLPVGRTHIVCSPPAQPHCTGPESCPLVSHLGSHC